MIAVCVPPREMEPDCSSRRTAAMRCQFDDARERGSMDQFEREWEKVKRKVVAEREVMAREPNKDEIAELENCDREELLSIIQGLPRTAIHAALRRCHRKV